LKRFYDLTLGAEGKTRRAQKRAAYQQARAELYDPHRLTQEELWALMEVAPSPEAERIGLPIFPGINQIAQHPEEMIEAAAKNARFLRAVRLDLPYRYSGDRLGQLVSEGKLELEQAARLCGAFLVGCHYGLYDNRVAGHAVRHPQNRLVPHGFILSAFVDSVRNAGPISDEVASQLDQGVESYSGIQSQRKLKDIEPGQFTNGTAAGDPKPCLYLLDIDLRFV